MKKKFHSHYWLNFILLAGLLSLVPFTVERVEASDSENIYIIQPGDVLQVSVWREPELQREVVVRPDGGFSFPLVGEIHAFNMTVKQIQQEISIRLSKFIPDAEVAVALAEIRGNTIYVMGQVANPGEFLAVRRIDVVQALSMAGGMTEYAAQNKIKILRRENGKQLAIPFRYGDVEKGQKLEQNIVLQGGDVIVVP